MEQSTWIIPAMYCIFFFGAGSYFAGKSSGINKCRKILEGEFEKTRREFEIAKRDVYFLRQLQFTASQKYRALLKRYMARVMDIEGETFIENGIAHTFGEFNEEEREALIEIFHELRN